MNGDVLRPRHADAARTLARSLARRVLPAVVYRRVMRTWRGARRLGRPVRWGTLRRTTPVSWFGFDRGTPVDRFYIEHFLTDHRTDIRGRVLEIESDAYTRQFGDDRVRRSDVLYARPGFAGATLTGDLSTGAGIPVGVFDCIILTQTLPFIYDVHSAAGHVARALAPGGVLLATVPGITRISRRDMELWGEFWRFTSLSMRRLLEEAFPVETVSIEAYGNVLTAIAFLHGVAAEELTRDELAYRDADFEVLIGARAVRPSA